MIGEKLADSLTDPLPGLTPGRVFGRLSMPGKTTAVVGMRRAGKTTFLHQLRLEGMEGGTARTLLPYVNFEDERLADLQGRRCTSRIAASTRAKTTPHTYTGRDSDRDCAGGHRATGL